MTTWNDYAYIWVRGDKQNVANQVWAASIVDLYPYFDAAAQEKTFSVWVSEDGTWENQVRRMWVGTSTRITDELKARLDELKNTNLPSFVHAHTAGETGNAYGFPEVGDWQGSLARLQSDLGWSDIVVLEPDENGVDPVPPEYRP